MNKSRLLGPVFNGERDIVDLTHKLTAITYAEREAVVLLDEPVELLADGIVEENARSPTSSTVQYILEVNKSMEWRESQLEKGSESGYGSIENI